MKIPSRKNQILVLLALMVVAFVSQDAMAQQSKDGIGFVIASNGSVSVTSKSAGPRPASLRQAVFPHDVIKTGPDSTMKILFDDNTILNVTENSQVEITEYVFDPKTAQRNTIFNITKGRVKALVASFYAATNSRFEIRTPNAVAAARGTEYVVWTFFQNGELFTGVASKGGSVNVTNLTNQTVTVGVGQYTIIGPNGAPTPPAPFMDNMPVQLQIQNGEVKTDPSVIGQVTVTMAKQEKDAKEALEALEPEAKLGRHDPGGPLTPLQPICTPIPGPPVASGDGSRIIGCR